MSNELPTAKLRIIDPENAHQEMLDFAQHLISLGERPWFEVRYSRPEGHEKTVDEWESDQEETYDAVELVDGGLVTLPPYKHLLGEEVYAPEEGFGQ